MYDSMEDEVNSRMLCFNSDNDGIKLDISILKELFIMFVKENCFIYIFRIVRDRIKFDSNIKL